MTTRLTFTCLSMVCVFLVVPGSEAQLITPISQNRYVNDPYHSQSCGDFGSFNGSVSDSGTLGGGGNYSVSASQNSEIDASSILGSGTADVSVWLGHGFTSSSASYFDVKFSLAVPCSMVMSGTVYAMSGGYGNITLSGSPGTLFQSGGSGSTTTTNGVLAAGQYELLAQANASTGAGHGSYSFDLELAVIPEPATIALAGSALVGLILCGKRRTTVMRSVGAASVKS